MQQFGLINQYCMYCHVVLSLSLLKTQLLLNYYVQSRTIDVFKGEVCHVSDFLQETQPADDVSSDVEGDVSR